MGPMSTMSDFHGMAHLTLQLFASRSSTLQRMVLAHDKSINDVDVSFMKIILIRPTCTCSGNVRDSEQEGTMKNS